MSLKCVIWWVSNEGFRESFARYTVPNPIIVRSRFRLCGPALHPSTGQDEAACVN